MTTEAEHCINFSEEGNKFCLSLHYNGRYSYLFVNGVKIYQFKTKDSDLNAYPLRLGNISKDFEVGNMKNGEQHEYVYDFSVDYDSIAADDVRDIHKYLIKKHKRK